MPIDLRYRHRQSELMDDPSLADDAHRQALTGLRRINWWSRTDASVWKAIRKVALEAGTHAPLTVLDIASGGGDLAIRLARIAKRERVPLQIDGCDISPAAIRYSTEQAISAKLPNVTFHPCNALKDPLPRPDYDVVMCSLFLHHLTEQEALLLLQRMKAAARTLILIDDLRRTRMGYWLAWLGCRILTRCHVVHVDGPMSVEGAFTSAEARAIAEQAGVDSPTVRHHWPERFLLTWHPKSRGCDDVN